MATTRTEPTPMDLPIQWLVRQGLPHGASVDAIICIIMDNIDYVYNPWYNLLQFLCYSCCLQHCVQDTNAVPALGGIGYGVSIKSAISDVKSPVIMHFLTALALLRTHLRFCMCHVLDVQLACMTDFGVSGNTFMHTPLFTLIVVLL